MRSLALRLAALALATGLAACGGGGSDGAAGTTATTPTGTGTTATPATTTPTAPATPVTPAAPTVPPVQLAAAANVLSVTVDRGTDGNALNMPYVTVTVCEPGTSNCQDIDHVLVDTGSYGLRVAASALPGSVRLPDVTTPAGTPLVECASFVSGFAWGPVRRADVRMAGESATALPVQVVDDAAYGTVPAACSNTGPKMGVGNGAKGILGIGFQVQDCGAACVNSAAPAMYFACTGSFTCSTTAVPLASQVTNPVARFATDNNGAALVLPDVPLGGVGSLGGALLFGIGTQPNNQLGTRTVFTATSTGNFTTTYKGRPVSAFIDSGSNGVFFRDTTLPCSGSGFYCPASALTLAASVTGANQASQSVLLRVESPDALASGSAVGYLAGNIGIGRNFDWGLPFFFGRTVFVALQGAATPGGTGPFWAF